MLDYYNNESKDELFVTPEKSYKLIKPLVGYKDNLVKQIKNTEFNKNIFLMMKYRNDPYKYSNEELYETIKNLVEKAGFHCVRADQDEWTHLTEESAFNPLAVLFCCKYGIALIDKPEPYATYNPNVMYEYGMMDAQGKVCILLRDKEIQGIPFDLTTKNHCTYSKKEDIERHLWSWLMSLEDFYG